MAHTNSFKIAVVSLILYLLLFVCSLYQYVKHKFMQIEGNGGRYLSVKLSFFSILAMSALLDMPTYIACIQLNGPYQCEWYTSSYIVFWVSHLLAMCGYVFILTIPPLLWDDIVNGREGKLIFQEWPRDVARKVFCGCVIAYFIGDIYAIICAIFFTDIHSHNNFYDNEGSEATISQLAVMMESFSILLLATACLFYGVKLQLHVMKTGIDTAVLRKLLIQLNVVLAIVVLCYLARALLIVTLFNGTPESYTIAMGNQKDHYGWWLLLTRWLPHIFCSLCLLHVMSRNSNSPRNTLATPSTPGLSTRLIGCHPALSGDSDGRLDEDSILIGNSMSNRVGSGEVQESGEVDPLAVFNFVNKVTWGYVSEPAHEGILPRSYEETRNLLHQSGVHDIETEYEATPALRWSDQLAGECDDDASNPRSSSMNTNDSEVSESGLYLSII